MTTNEPGLAEWEQELLEVQRARAEVYGQGVLEGRRQAAIEMINLIRNLFPGDDEVTDGEATGP
jgi:hypothetical protein